MKIIHTDNFGGDYPNEQFVENVPPMCAEDCRAICDIINQAIGPHANRFYKVVEDDYKLQPGFEP
jgi:hypothetical protein